MQLQAQNSAMDSRPFQSELAEENATLRAYLREALDHVNAAATNMDKEAMPWSARNARQFSANAKRYMEGGHE